MEARAQGSIMKSIDSKSIFILGHYHLPDLVKYADMQMILPKSHIEKKFL